MATTKYDSDDSSYDSDSSYEYISSDEQEFGMEKQKVRDPPFGYTLFAHEPNVVEQFLNHRNQLFTISTDNILKVMDVKENETRENENEPLASNRRQRTTNDNPNDEDGNAFGMNVHWNPFRVPTQSKVCEICWDTFDNPTDLHDLGCGHRFCGPCWTAHIDSELNSTNRYNLTCPSPTCDLALTRQRVQFVAPALLDLYNTRQVEAFVTANATSMCWCPGPDCGFIAVKPPDDLLDAFAFCCVQCQTRFEFIESTTEQQLLPPSTSTSVPNAIRTAYGDVSTTTNNNLTTKIKRCPQCHFVIEKNGGCPHIHCVCGADFCWICLKRYSEDEGYIHHCDNTNEAAQEDPVPAITLDYVKKALSGDLSAAELLQQIGHLEKYVRHLDSYRSWGVVEEVHREAWYSEFTSGLSNKAEYELEAMRSLFLSYSVLKYAEISLFYGNAPASFVFRIEQLSRFAAELAESMQSPDARAQVLNLTHAVTRSMESVSIREKSG